jgi:hypothetical protein
MADVERVQRDLKDRFSRLVRDSNRLDSSLPADDAIFILCALEEACDRITELAEKLDQEEASL